MNKNKTVIINGKSYDAVSGLAIEDTPKPYVTPKRPTAASGVHQTPQKSKTLIRRTTKKPAGANRSVRKPGVTMDIARSRSVSHFAPHPVISAKKTTEITDIAPTRHPIVHKIQSIHAAKKAMVVSVPATTSKQVKEQAISTALSTQIDLPVKAKKKLFAKRHSKVISIISICVAAALVAAYITYLNMPALSVRVAAAQAGINATYPQYKPDGYGLDGPVTYTDGAVSIHFVANTGTSKFSITQSKSSWDSSAVLDNVVRKAVGDQYITNQERGLTIYTYNGNAAWVNAGILYIIQGDAPLSGDQIRHIATSL
jgi:hypothetical protein